MLAAARSHNRPLLAHLARLFPVHTHTGDEAKHKHGVLGKSGGELHPGSAPPPFHAPEMGEPEQMGRPLRVAGGPSGELEGSGDCCAIPRP